jgi:LPXTG-motif cell wall-anchored protein
VPGASAGPPTVNNNVANTPTQTPANTQTQNDEGQVKGLIEGETGVQGQGGSQGGGGGQGGGQVLAQTDTGEESGSGQSTRGSQPAELASTGVNTGALALIGALCVAGSLLLFRRRRTA